MKSTEKAIRDFCGHHADWWPSTTQVQEMLALAQPAPVQEPVKPEPFGYFQYDIRLDAWVQNRINNKGVAFYTKEKNT